MSNDHTHGVPAGYNSVFYGYVLSIALFGVTLVQGWNYITTNSDHWPMRVFVAFLLGMETAASSLSIQVMHHYLINNFGNLDSLNTMSYSFDVQLAITVIVVFIVNVFFVVRIYRRRPGNRSLPIIILLLATAGLAIGSAFIVECALRPEVGTSGNVQKGNIASIHATATAANVMITLGLTLSQSRERSDSILHKFFTYGINYGVLITIAQAITLLLYAIDTSRLYWMALYLGMNKLYIITVVAMLNYESRSAACVRGDVSINNITFDDTSNQDGAASANIRSTNMNRSDQHIIDLSQTKQDTSGSAGSPLKVPP
ncbi:uncharacterized protein EV420DRAFT_872105 [Desarmillaria tabescens]|uniref:DUF6534 domain-containing protein n=1 Tax=Armillaria tabescens TaxID=1929756 RepID=A0AA39MVJ2_ARMTA|nr:uncharacterized protein EV420DRAFT_872105 [Desarmillaria tabescens]KAK0447395.1 hypothetical protein EV420DRAFT_872105 [Desarmillaria tabescens]